jgi:hypothetical protein
VNVKIFLRRTISSSANALQLTAVATTLDFICMDYCTRSMSPLTNNLSIDSSLQHCVATAHVSRKLAVGNSVPFQKEDRWKYPNLLGD